VNISVELFGQLLPDTPRAKLNLPPKATVQEAAALLRLNFEEIGLITIDGVQSEMSDTLLQIVGCVLPVSIWWIGCFSRLA